MNNRQTDTNQGDTADATMKAYRLSLGMPAIRLAARTGLSTGDITALEDSGQPMPADIEELLSAGREALTAEVRGFLETEQEMHDDGEADREEGAWDLPLYRSQREFEADRPETPIDDWHIWNQAYLVIGLLLEPLGYQISYHYTENKIQAVGARHGRHEATQ